MIEILSSATVILWLCIGAIVGITIALEVESESIATIILVAILSLLGWNYGCEVLEVVSNNFGFTILCLIGYTLLGVAWSFIKWNFVVKAVFDKFRVIKEQFYGTGERGVLTLNDKTEFIRAVKANFETSGYMDSNESYEGVVKAITPRGSKYQGSIVAWISYWPLSLIGTLINNPFRKFFQWVYGLFSNWYDVISKRHSADLYK